MLKWTSLQKLPETPRARTSLSFINTPVIDNNKSKRSMNRKRRATVAFNNSNKENLITSTPLIEKSSALLTRSLACRRSLSNYSQQQQERQHSSSPANKVLIETPKYASTLPKFAEEYSPNPPSIFPTGQFLAIRGLLPDSYCGNPRYLLNTPETPAFEKLKNIKKSEHMTLTNNITTTRTTTGLLQLRKRKLENDFSENENSDTSSVKDDKSTTTNTMLGSSKLGDLTLDKLIDAIIDSTTKTKDKIKDHHHKTKRKSLINLRRRTLLKNTSTNVNLILSPTYKPAEDPCSDLSFSEFNDPLISTISVIGSDVEKDLKISEKNDCSILISNNLENDNNEKSRPRQRRSSNSRKYFEVGLSMPSIYV